MTEDDKAELEILRAFCAAIDEREAANREYTRTFFRSPESEEERYTWQRLSQACEALELAHEARAAFEARKRG